MLAIHVEERRFTASPTLDTNDLPLDPPAVLRQVDKIDKIGPEGVAAELAQSGIDAEQASVLLEMAQIRTADSGEVRERLACLGVGGELLLVVLEQVRKGAECQVRVRTGARWMKRQ